MLTLADVAAEAAPFSPEQMTLLAAAWVDDAWGVHDLCTLTACRLPLHPGPCKGWKHTLHMTAPGVYHALESSRVEKANQKRLAKIAALKAEGKKVPASLLKPITYGLPKPPPEHQIGQHAEVVGGEAHKASQEANKAAGVVAKVAPKLHGEKLSTAGVDAAEKAKDTLGEAAKPKPAEVGKPTYKTAKQHGLKEAMYHGMFEKPKAEGTPVKIVPKGGLITFVDPETGGKLGAVGAAKKLWLSPMPDKGEEKTPEAPKVTKPAGVPHKTSPAKAAQEATKAKAEEPAKPQVKEPTDAEKAVKLASGPSTGEFLTHLNKVSKTDFEGLSKDEQEKITGKLNFIATHPNAPTSTKEKAGNLLDFYGGKGIYQKPGEKEPGKVTLGEAVKPAEVSKPAAPKTPEVKEPVKQHPGVAALDAVTGESHAGFLAKLAEVTPKDFIDLPIADRVTVRKHLATIADHGNADNSAKAKKLQTALLSIGHSSLKIDQKFGDHNPSVPEPAGSQAEKEIANAAKAGAHGYNVHQNDAVKIADSPVVHMGDLSHKVDALTKAEFDELKPEHQKKILDVLSMGQHSPGALGDKMSVQHGILTGKITPTFDKTDHKPSVGELAAAHFDEHAKKNADFEKKNAELKAKIAAEAKPSVNAVAEKATVGGEGANALAPTAKLTDKAKAAHELANSDQWTMSKVHLETYEPLSKDEYLSLDKGTQAKIRAQLEVALQKLKDPKKIAATKTLIDKFNDAAGIPKAPAKVEKEIAAKVEEQLPAAKKLPDHYNGAQELATLAAQSKTIDDYGALSNISMLSKADYDGLDPEHQQQVIDKLTSIAGKGNLDAQLAKKYIDKLAAAPAPKVEAPKETVPHVDVPELDTSTNTWPDGYNEAQKQAATMAYQAAKGTGPSLTFAQRATLIDKLSADDWKALKESHRTNLIAQINAADEAGVKGIDGLRERFGLAKPGGASPYVGGKPGVKPVTIVKPGGFTKTGGNHLDIVKSPDFASMGTGASWPALKELTPDEYNGLSASTKKVIAANLADIATLDTKAADKAKELGVTLPDKHVGGINVPGHYSLLQTEAATAPGNPYLHITDQLGFFNKLNADDFAAMTPEHRKAITDLLDQKFNEAAPSSSLRTMVTATKAQLAGESGSKAKASSLKEEAAQLAGNAAQQKADAIAKVHAKLGPDVTPFDEETIGKTVRYAYVSEAKKAISYGTSGKWQAKQSLQNSVHKDDTTAAAKELYQKVEELAVAHAHAKAGTPGAAEKLKTAEADYKAAHAKADALVQKMRQEAGLTTKHLPQWNAASVQKQAGDEIGYKLSGYGKPLAGDALAGSHYLVAKLGDKNATSTYAYSKTQSKAAADKLKEAADLEKNAAYFDAQAASKVEAHKANLAKQVEGVKKGTTAGSPSPATAAALGVHYMPEGPMLGTGGYGSSAFDGKPAYVDPTYAAWADRAQAATRGTSVLHHYKSIASMTGHTKSVFVGYTESNYESINQALIKAGPGGTVTGSAATLKKAYADLPAAKSDIVLFRGMRRMSQKFGEQANDTNMVGASFDQLGASSTSVQQSTADNFAYLGQDPFVIRVLLREGQGIRGTNAAEGGSHSPEAEVILEPGLRYTVVADYGVVDGRRRFDVVAEKIPTKAE